MFAMMDNGRPYDHREGTGTRSSEIAFAEAVKRDTDQVNVSFVRPSTSYDKSGQEDRKVDKERLITLSYIKPLKTIEDNDQSKITYFKVKTAEARQPCVHFTVLTKDVPNNTVCIFTGTELGSTSQVFDKDNKNILKQVLDIMQAKVNLEFFDVGCDVGIYSVAVASLGSNVTAVDADRLKLLQLAMSNDINGLPGNVTILWNAVSDNEMSSADSQSRRSSETDDVNKALLSNTPNDTASSPTAVTLNDFNGLFRNKQIFMKIDIDGVEWLGTSSSFFDSVAVKYILMKWSHHKGQRTSSFIVEYLTGLGYEPYRADDIDIDLYISYMNTGWPADILWIKKS